MFDHSTFNGHYRFSDRPSPSHCSKPCEKIPAEESKNEDTPWIEMKTMKKTKTERKVNNYVGSYFPFTQKPQSKK